MFRFIRTSTLRALNADLAALGEARTDRDNARTEAATATDSAIRAENVVEDLLTQLGQAHVDTMAARRETTVQFEGLKAVIRQVTGERDEARSERDEARGERDAAQAQVLLDAEDRVALRTLLRLVRKQNRTDRVFVLFRRGELHSIHASVEAAEIAAEAEGAPRDGWTAHAPGAASPPAAEVLWRVQPLPVGGVQ